jgi:hypothetical protein
VLSIAITRAEHYNRSREKEEIMDQEQRRFWNDLLAYYRQELQERQSPAMVSMLGFLHGEERALQDKRLAARGHVYLLDRGKLRIKLIDQLDPSDAPYLMAELEANQAMAEEHSAVDDEQTVTQFPGGATFTHPHYEDATEHLRKQWRNLKETWRPAETDGYPPGPSIS